LRAGDGFVGLVLGMGFLGFGLDGRDGGGGLLR